MLEKTQFSSPMSKYTYTKNYIKEYKNFVPQKLAQEIIHQQDLSFYPATTGGGKLNIQKKDSFEGTINLYAAQKAGIPTTWAEDMKMWLRDKKGLPGPRYASDFNTKQRYIIESIPWDWTEDKVNAFFKKHKLDPKFNKEIGDVFRSAFKSYIQEFHFFDYIKGDTTGWDHVLYIGERAQEYKEHVDFSSNQGPRILTCSLILNDDYDGGDFTFFEGEYTIPKKSCSAIVFPSNFCFPHAVTPVSNGDRHVVITWVR